MRALPILAVVLLFVPGVAQAEPRAESAIEADIAQVDGRIREVEKTIEEGGGADARMQTALEECDRLDAIYAGYRKRLVVAQQAVNAAHRAYKEQFRLASVMGPCNAQKWWWSFCNLPYAEDLVGFKTCGPYKKSLTKAHDEFIATRTAFEAEKRAVATELPRDTELLSLGLGAFDDYFAFKRAYLERKAECDGRVRPYFRDRKSFVELQGAMDQLRTRRAQLEEELAAIRVRRPPVPATKAGDAHIAVLWPRLSDLQKVPLQDQTWGPKGLPFRAQVLAGTGVVEPGRLYRFVAELGQRSFTVYGRGRAPEGRGPPILTFRAILPARLGPFQLRLSSPEEPGIRAVTVSGALVPPNSAEDDLAEARADLSEAQAPRPGTDPTEVQRYLCRTHCDVALALMRLDRVKESVRAAREVTAIFERNRPASDKWRTERDATWSEVLWIFTQEALARRDVVALENLYLARADVYQQIIVEDRKGGNERTASARFSGLREGYRELGDLVVLLTGDLDRARKHWRTGRALLHPDEQEAPNEPGFDPVWFAP